MNDVRTGAARTVVAALALLLAPLLAAAESWHTCTLPAGLGSGHARLVASADASPEAGPCPACSLARHSRLSPPGREVPCPGAGPALAVIEARMPARPAGARLRPAGRAPPA